MTNSQLGRFQLYVGSYTEVLSLIELLVEREENHER